MPLVLLNASAGGGRAARLEATIRDALKLHHPGVPLRVTQGIAEAQRTIGELPRGSRVVLVGGDGTLHQVLRPLMEGAHELGLVPAGSGDDSARALGLRGLAPLRALSRALTGPAVALDVGWLTTAGDDRPFFSSVNAGFDAAIAQRALAGPAWLRGLPRYLLATLREVAALRLHELRVELDGQPWHDGPALFVSVLNTPTYGGGMPAVPHARLDDGRLDVLLAGRFGRAGVLAMLPRLLAGRHLGHPRVHCASFGTLRVEAGAPLPLAADGEPLAASTWLTARAAAGRLRVVTGPDGLGTAAPGVDAR